MSEENVFLDDGQMFVSNSRVVLSGTTYSTANITSVKKYDIPAKKGGPHAVIVLGVLALFGGFIKFSESFLTGLSGVLLAGGFLVLGIIWSKSRRWEYLVILTSASSEAEALRSQDEAIIDRVVAAVSEAIVSRG